MKKILAFVLICSIFSVSLFGIKKDVYATSVVVGGVTYVTAESILGVVCTCLMLAGIIEEADNVDLISQLEELFNPNTMSPEEVEAYAQQQIVEMENICDALIANGNMYPREYTYAWLLLASAPTIIEGAQILADALNDSRAKGQNLDGTPLETNSKGVPTIDSINNGSTAFQDTETDSVVVSPSIINGLVQDIDYIVNQLLYEHSTVQFSEDIAGYSTRFNYHSPDFSDVQLGEYGTFSEVCDNAVASGGGYMLCHNATSFGTATYSLYTWDNTVEQPRLYCIDDDTYNVFVCKQNIYYFNEDGTYKNCQLNVSSSLSIVDFAYSSLGIIYYTVLDVMNDGVFSYPTSWTYDNVGNTLDLSYVTDTTLVDYYDVDVDEYGNSKPIVNELVLVPPVEDVVAGVGGLIVDNGGIPRDTAPDCIIKGIVVDIPQIVVPAVSSDVAGVLEETDTYSNTDDSNAGSETTPVITGWEWLDAILNVILSVLDAILSAITGIVQGIIDGIASLLEWLLEGLEDMLVYLFVPDSGYLERKVDGFMANFSFFEDIIASAKMIGNLFSNNDEEPPQIVVDLSASDSDIDYGNEFIIDFAWFAPYKETTDGFISAFLWVVFIWNTFKRIPSIVTGTGNIADAVSWSNKPDNKESDSE